MGNRGCLHDDNRNVVRDRKVKAWITCSLSFSGRQRTLMRPGYYTEPFFLDEATALAAGHRPCADCRREDYNRVKAAFVNGAKADGRIVSSAAEIDAAIHTARMEKLRPAVNIGTLPGGAMIDIDGAPWLKQGNTLHRWTEAGYDLATPVSGQRSTAHAAAGDREPAARVRRADPSDCDEVVIVA